MYIKIKFSFLEYSLQMLVMWIDVFLLNSGKVTKTYITKFAFGLDDIPLFVQLAHDISVWWHPSWFRFPSALFIWVMRFSVIYGLWGYFFLMLLCFSFILSITDSWSVPAFDRSVYVHSFGLSHYFPYR